MTLRDLIQDAHTDAENSPFAKLLMSGKITKHQYANYLYQQEGAYHALENRANDLDLLDDIPDIKRALKITADYMNLQVVDNFELFPSVQEYITYVAKLDEDQCWAHIYVRHFGDMYGGTHIQHMVPGPTKLMYQFETKGKNIKYVRDKLKPEMEHEAKQVFKYAITLFKELENYYGME